MSVVSRVTAPKDVHVLMREPVSISPFVVRRVEVASQLPLRWEVMLDSGGWVCSQGFLTTEEGGRVTRCGCSWKSKRRTFPLEPPEGSGRAHTLI